VCVYPPITLRSSVITSGISSIGVRGREVNISSYWTDTMACVYICNVDLEAQPDDQNDHQNILRR